MRETIIPLCKKVTNKHRKLKLICIFYGLPAIFIFSIYYLYNSKSYFIFLALFGLFILLKVLLTFNALAELRIAENGVLSIYRGINRAWNKLKFPPDNTLVYYSSIKKGSSFTLKLLPNNINAITVAEGPIQQKTLSQISLENPKTSPFVLGDNVIGIKVEIINLINLRPLQRVANTLPEKVENTTIYISIESRQTFYQALSNDLKAKCFPLESFT